MSANDKGKSSGKPLDQGDYRLAVDLMQFLVVPAFVLDAQGRVLIWNDACARLTGLPASEVLGTKDHWRAFYDAPRPCLADLIVQNRVEEIEALYAVQDERNGGEFGRHVENWCTMPRLGTKRYLAIDAGPIHGADGELLAVIETLRDMSEQKLAQAELERLATNDGLTGIVNRRGFDARLQAEWNRANREQTLLSLLLIDVDHFKQYNDTYGHQKGDECLKAIAASLSRAAFRPSDLIARYGGEEFAVLLPGVDEEGARVVAARTRDAVNTLGIAHRGGEGGLVTVSIGISSLSAQEMMTPEELVANADRALYQAKRIGRDSIVSQDWIS